MTANITTNPQPTLTQIIIYPIKSLAGVSVKSAEISPGGTLEFDRRWAIVDSLGKIVNAKRTAKIHQLRSQFDLRLGSISLQSLADNTTETFSLTTELAHLTDWLSEFFGFPISLIENATTGFPDDLNAYGPTIISTATLAAV